MAMDLIELVRRLQADVPARGGIPSHEQAERLVKQAVADYGDLAPTTKRLTLNLVTGTATYNLPADFVRLMRLERAIDVVGGVSISAAGIVPVNLDEDEEWFVSNNQITFYPTPQFNDTRILYYAAGFSLASGTYAEMDERQAGRVLLKAQALALQIQANKAAQDAWQYDTGNERVNKERLAEALRKQANDLERQYKEEVAALGFAPYGTWA